MDTARFLTFCATFFMISLSPGLCMTLSLSLGVSVGVRRALWMMLGELVGVALVGAAALGGVAALLFSAPQAFMIAKLIGAAYLIWCAVKAWRSPVKIALSQASDEISTTGLISQGFITAVSNPKAWIFFAALLPPFIDPQQSLLPQAVVLLSVMVIIEFICLLIYAQGGRMLRDYLANRGLGQWLNRIAAGLMVGVAFWLVLG
ncbi:MAG: LysE family translocator [Arenicella sp.]|jgi:homoserine/homoserine lactone efflux protein|nr:LysE family translocator [Arenicella sp.]